MSSLLETYSTTEHVIGKWVNGSNIYSRTFAIKASDSGWTTQSNNRYGASASVTEHVYSNISFSHTNIIDVEACYIATSSSGGKERAGTQCIQNSTTYYCVLETTIYISDNYFKNLDTFYVTIKYIK